MGAINLEKSGLPGTRYDPLYPECDGRPMGETYWHSEAIRMLMNALEDFFSGFANVFFATNILFYFEEGNPAGRKDPDILVARGVRGHPRLSYRLWEEHALPCTLFEIASKKTWRIDLTEKRELYARIGIPEYFVFDPHARFVKPPLRGFQLRRGAYTEMVPGADCSLISKKLGLCLVPERRMLRLVNLKTGEPILTREEQAEKARRQSREQRRIVAAAKRQADEERRKALESARLAEEQKQRADELAAEVERLRKRLGKQE